MSSKQYLSVKDLLDRYSGEIAEGTLRNWRSLGKGPAYVKAGGRVLYPVKEVEAWEKARTKGRKR